jgi:UDP-2,3-diacylglucosamine hydrolase
MISIQLHSNKKIYFASDFHLGYPTPEESLARERKIVRWLDQISADAQVIFLVGDIFDFWFEYKNAIPKGFIRLQNLAELSDSGIELILLQEIMIFGYSIILRKRWVSKCIVTLSNIAYKHLDK